MADILVIEDGVLEECTDKSATSVKIPDGVTEIGVYAFSGCTSLSSVVIPSSVTEIGGGRSMVASRLRQLRFRRA